MTAFGVRPRFRSDSARKFAVVPFERVYGTTTRERLLAPGRSKSAQGHDGAVRADASRTSQSRRPALSRIMEEVAVKHGVSKDAIRGRRRHRRIVRARQEFCYRARRETGRSLNEIARAINRLDHTTITHAVKVHARRHDLPE